MVKSSGHPNQKQKPKFSEYANSMHYRFRLSTKESRSMRNGAFQTFTMARDGSCGDYSMAGVTDTLQIGEFSPYFSQIPKKMFLRVGKKRLCCEARGRPGSRRWQPACRKGNGEMPGAGVTGRRQVARRGRHTPPGLARRPRPRREGPSSRPMACPRPDQTLGRNAALAAETARRLPSQGLRAPGRRFHRTADDSRRFRLK